MQVRITTAGRLGVKTELKISKPVHEVFEAIVNPKKMSRYFITTSSHRMETGKTVHWSFADVGVELDAKVKKVEEDRYVSFVWSASGVEALVEMKLEPIGETATLVKVSETGWPSDESGIARCVEQSKGWVHFLCCLKAFLEYGINLRSGGPIWEAGRLMKTRA